MALDRNSFEYLLRRVEGGANDSSVDIVKLRDRAVGIQAELRYQRRKLEEVTDAISDRKIFSEDPKDIVREIRSLERAKRELAGEQIKCDLALALLSGT